MDGPVWVLNREVDPFPVGVDGLDGRWLVVGPPGSLGVLPAEVVLESLLGGSAFGAEVA